MCTAVTYHTKDHYFGRTLDLDYSYDETITITPRNYPLRFRRVRDLDRHYAIIGVAYVVDDYPLYYDGTNEAGLSIAGLRFPRNAVYFPETFGKDNVASYELIPWLLGQCADVEQARRRLEQVSILDVGFNEELPASPLHWMISDRERSITVESVESGLKVYDNPIGVLTNNPPFEFQLTYLDNFLNLTRDAPTNRFAASLSLEPYSLGMGAMGLPGDLSSASRFVKAAFIKMNSISEDSESESVSQFFHILGSVAQARGCVCLGGDKYMTTRYTSCCNADKGFYYYTTYGNSQISEVDLHRENLDRCNLISYPLIQGQQIRLQN